MRPSPFSKKSIQPSQAVWTDWSKRCGFSRKIISSRRRNSSSKSARTLWLMHLPLKSSTFSAVNQWRISLRRRAASLPSSRFSLTQQSWSIWTGSTIWNRCTNTSPWLRALSSNQSIRSVRLKRIKSPSRKISKISKPSCRSTRLTLKRSSNHFKDLVIFWLHPKSSRKITIRSSPRAMNSLKRMSTRFFPSFTTITSFATRKSAKFWKFRFSRS